MANLTASSVYDLGTVLQDYKSLSSMEILPGSIDQWLPRQEDVQPPRPFILVEGNLGIPLKSLHQLYTIAVDLFISHRQKQHLGAEPGPDLLAITMILLLANPAHQTALNARKRLVRANNLSAEDELKTFALLQASKSCAKESILWDYRRWLLRHLFSGVSGLPVPADVIQDELRLVSKAVDSYPRNYHAWTHRRFCIQLCLPTDPTQPDELFLNQIQLLLDEYAHLQAWIRQHISDYSSIHCLHGLVLVCLQYKSRWPSIASCFADIEAKMLFADSFSLVVSYPEHESLWMYLRASIALEANDQARQSMIAKVKTLPENGVQQRKRCLTWLEMVFSANSEERNCDGLPT